MGVTVGATVTINNASRPTGCLMDPVASAPGTYDAVFNTAASTVSCAPPHSAANDFEWQGPIKSSVCATRVECG